MGEAWDEATAEAWTTTYGAVVDMMLKGVETDADAIPEEENTPQHENTVQFEEGAKFRPRKKLTYTQKVKLKDRKTLLTVQPLVLGQSNVDHCPLCYRPVFLVFFCWTRSNRDSTNHRHP